MSDITDANLDARSRESVSKINDMITQVGRMPK